jgi:heptosyltransferase-2
MATTRPCTTLDLARSACGAYGAPLKVAESSQSVARPLIVRLRHWVGDVILGVPALRMLESQGYRLHLVGKGWAGELLSGEGWAVQPLAKGLLARTSQLRRIRVACAEQDPNFDRRMNTLVLPFSFSSALDARLAGLRALGYAHEGRSPLLERALPRVGGRHELLSYWSLAAALRPNAQSEPPAAIDLRVTDRARRAVRERLARTNVGPGFVVLCPFAGGTFKGLDKRWPEFGRFVSRAMQAWNRPLVLCPGPGEADGIQDAYPGAVVIEGLHLDGYAALLQYASLMVSNDTGPGHLAAAVRTPLVSVLGPTDARQWGPWGPSAHVVQRAGGWPSVDEVLAVGERLLASAHAAWRWEE